MCEGGATRRADYFAGKLASALVIAHVQVSRSLILGCFRRYSVDSGRVCFDSNATTDSRHTFSATVSRSIVRDIRGPREVARRAARIREKQSRVRDEDGETIVIEQLDKNYRRKRGEDEEDPVDFPSSSSLSSSAITRRQYRFDLSSRARALRDRSSCARTAAVKSAELRAKGNEIWYTEEDSTWWKR
jgi:hypothetical protein